MSYYDDSQRAFDDTPKPPGFFSTAAGTVLAAGVLMLLAIGIWKFPEIRKQWLETDPDFLLRMREVEARADADLHFRKREAELKAEADVVASRLDSQALPPNPLHDVVARIGPSVVNVEATRAQVESERRRQLPGPMRGHPFLDMDEPAPSEGSGVLVRVDDDRRCYVLTNCHVIRDAAQLFVTLQSGRRIKVPASQVYSDKETDLAVLWFDAANLDHLVPAEFADSDKVLVGDPAIAIGSPFGLKQSVTSGIVSAKGRSNLIPLAEMIQTDAAINPGNSGGPLLDGQGRVIGINTMIFTRNGSNQGIGFAVPSNTVKWVFEQLIEEPHKISRGFLGIQMNDLPEEQALKLGVRGGVVVTSVAKDTPASQAGLEMSDVIIRYNRVEVTSFRQLLKLVTDTPPGTKVALNVLRLEDGRPTPLDLKLTVAERPPPR